MPDEVLIHVKNLEKYQPTYTDGRRLIWIRWNCGAISDYKITRLTPQQRYLFIGLICLETIEGKPIPWDEKFLAGVLHYPKTPIHKDLLMLQECKLFVTECHKMSPTDRQTDDTDVTNKQTEAVGKRKNFFKIPTVEEVSSHINEKGYGVDAEAFIAFYESKGWLVGKSPMKDWKAALITWAKRKGVLRDGDIERYVKKYSK